MIKMNGVKVDFRKGASHIAYCLEDRILVITPPKVDKLTVLFLLLHEYAHWKQCQFLELHKFYAQFDASEEHTKEFACLVTEVSADKYALRMLSYVGIAPQYMIRRMEEEGFEISDEVKARHHMKEKP